MEKNKVLIVDDIPENIETISEMIKDFDIDVKTANGGKEAIELIDSFKPDVILLVSFHSLRINASFSSARVSSRL